MSPNASRLGTRSILLFWAPLAATWLMMAFEGPFLAAVIARLVDPKFNLAAHGVAFGFIWAALAVYTIEARRRYGRAVEGLEAAEERR